MNWFDEFTQIDRNQQQQNQQHAQERNQKPIQNNYFNNQGKTDWGDEPNKKIQLPTVTVAPSSMTDQAQNKPWWDVENPTPTPTRSNNLNQNKASYQNKPYKNNHSTHQQQQKQQQQQNQSSPQFQSNFEPVPVKIEQTLNTLGPLSDGWGGDKAIGKNLSHSNSELNPSLNNNTEFGINSNRVNMQQSTKVHTGTRNLPIQNYKDRNANGIKKDYQKDAASCLIKAPNTKFHLEDSSNSSRSNSSSMSSYRNKSKKRHHIRDKNSDKKKEPSWYEQTFSQDNKHQGVLKSSSNKRKKSPSRHSNHTSHRKHQHHHHQSRSVSHHSRRRKAVKKEEETPDDHQIFTKLEKQKQRQEKIQQLLINGNGASLENKNNDPLKHIQLQPNTRKIEHDKLGPQDMDKSVKVTSIRFGEPNMQILCQVARTQTPQEQLMHQPLQYDTKIATSDILLKIAPELIFSFLANQITTNAAIQLMFRNYITIKE